METSNILETHNLSKTPCRVDIIDTLLATEVALTEQQLKENLKFDYDRATIFRTLKTFSEKGIIHCVPVEGNEVYYAISKPNYKQTLSHAHFHCSTCGGVYCLNSISIAEPQLPDGFAAQGYELTINGCCRKCKE
ncbi:MAG: transcriptional repressor [Bacteroidales bacterium]|nr:transcriptional repressor [Bacteroidales bacterium]MBN2748379.1 transcriptional repressor [Bacteroidales bacterium]